MRLTVFMCDCGAPKAHCKFRAPDGSDSISELVLIAADFLNVPQRKWKKLTQELIDGGNLTAASEDRILELLKDPEALREAKNLERVVGILAAVFPENREAYIMEGIKREAITPEFAEKLRARIKDLPHTPMDPAEMFMKALGSGSIIFIPIDHEGDVSMN